MKQKQEVTSISTTINRNMGKWKYPWCGLWLLLPILLVWEVTQTAWGEDIGPLITISIGALLIVWISRVAHSARTSFWKQFAKNHGWSYEEQGDASHEKGLMFNQSKSKSIVKHVISGKHEARNMRIFELTFTRGSGKNATTHFYTVFEFTMKGTFPHMYLSYKKNGYEAQKGKHASKIPLPKACEKKYNLYAPVQYEIEALEIFGESLLKFLLDEKFPHDVEMVDAEVLIFRKYHVNTLKDLEKDFEAAKVLLKQIEKKLDRSKLYKIGDRPHEMKFK